jgi:two-component system, cell cycle sensor histidine kinase and response regulator CckA
MERRNRLKAIPMNEQTIRILLVEDNPGDARLVREMLRDTPEMELHIVDRLSLAVDHLVSQETDIVLLDLGLPDSRGLDSLQAVYRAVPHVPIVVLTGQDDETTAMAAIRLGAQEYLSKSVMLGSMLARTLRFSFERKQAENSLRESEAKYRRLNESLMDGFVRLDMQGNIIEWNSTYQDMVGYEKDELRSVTYMQLTPERWHAFEAKIVAEQVLPRGYSDVYEKEYRRKNGEVFPVELRTSLLRDDAGAPMWMWAIVRDLTERKRAEESLRKSEEQYRLIADSTTDVIWLFDLTTDRYIYVSPSVERLLGYNVEEALRLTMKELLTPESYRILEDSLPKRLAALAAGDESARTQTYEMDHPRKDGSIVTAETVATLIADEQNRLKHMQGITRDISERRLLQKQLLQSHKMEGIGRLAGGIAHDFNNLLTVIVGYSEMLLNNASINDPARGELELIKGAGERAAALTSKLLAFSRKQIVQPRVLDLNALIKDSSKLLRRLVGEDIELITVPAPDLGLIKADMTQIEQVVFNLAVNSRDAMPQGGKLIFETVNVDLDASFVSNNLGSHPGRFVMLAVSDTGMGMDSETKSHIFEPFFTTKESNKGTGLGLATVYGIVKQSDGYITADSEPGRGTTIKIYLPRVDELVDRAKPFEAVEYEGSETILLVEDEEDVKKLAARWLEAKGYTVLTASNGPHALEIAERHSGTIDLLVTDMIMPHGLNGRELAERLQNLRPGIRALFISGYAAGLATNAVMDSDVKLLQKPFTSESLARKVREVLQQKSQGADSKTV